MGDLVRNAFRAKGIDEEVEQLIANAIVQSWSENCSKSLPVTERKLKDKANEPNLAKVRIIAEYLWRRLKQIYNVQLQAWKQNEEKTIEEMIARLRHEYRENLLLKQKQLEELAGRKDDEYKNKEDFLREDIRVIFENKKLECERAWREIEMAQKELRFQKELLDNARANFQSKKDNELCLIEQERCSLEQIKNGLKIYEKSLDQRLQEAIRKAREKDRAEIAQMIFEWNKKEAALSKKYEIIWGKICEISSGQQFSVEEAERLKKLQEEVTQQQKKLTENKQVLYDALHKQRKTNEDLERVKKKNEKLYETNQKLMEKVEKRNATISSLKKQLKLLEESAALRISELKFQHKLAIDKLQVLSAELHRYYPNALEKFKQPRSSSHPTTPVTARMTRIDSTSSSTLTESSFEHHLRDRMKDLNFTKQKLDFALEKLRERNHSQPLDYIQSISLSCTEISKLEKPASRNSSNHDAKRLQRDSSIIETNAVHEKMMETENTAHLSLKNVQNREVHETSNSSGNHVIDPSTTWYMKMIQDQRGKVEPFLDQTSKKGDTEVPEELFVMEAGEGSNMPNTPSDFDW
ncbi:hypothetical protein ACH3XW_20185 [Acanthocheilonema viteae]|uniref:Uncharacterized protein n=1 Tax=Acanthocheilonema viteae TaxID=6277 RepID=A0A498SE39_ACAVI|nr:unnamed protein product [Acanthocheilonema viteae]